MPRIAAWDNLQNFLLARYTQWMDRRIPPQNSIKLTQKNIFIFPNFTGFLFLSLVMVLWIAATNYQNNLAFALTFFLLAVFVISIHHTFLNLSGLQLQLAGVEPIFCGDNARFRILLKAKSIGKHIALELTWPDQPGTRASLLANQSKTIEVFYQVGHRGLFNPRRLRLKTVYPLGLMRCWTWVDLDASVMVYPKPIEAEYILNESHFSEKGEESSLLSHKKGSDEFHGFQSYVPGTPLSQIAWKQYARGKGLHVRENASYADETIWFDYDALHMFGSEERLSILCGWILGAEQEGVRYGLRLPDVTIEPSLGQEHKTQALTELALFGVSR